MGLVFQKNVFRKVLEVGQYTFYLKNKSVVVINQRYALENYGIELKTLQNKQLLEGKVTTVQVKEHEMAFHFVDGLFSQLLPSGSYTFFNETYHHSFTIVDMREIILPESIDLSIIESSKFNVENSKYKFLQSFAVTEGFVGVLTINGKFDKLLEAGKYYFCTAIHKVNVKLIDLRTQNLQISGQELLTKDKVTLRLNFILNYKINDGYKAATAFDNYQDHLYMVMQLALRSYVSSRTLDELLAEKHEAGQIILETVKAKEETFGATFIEAGLRDIILPGEIKDILNTILIAEKKAQANVITRREETASTRSLLNTAKLMEENTTLYKLKELEYLERICEKVGNISLTSGGSITEQLSAIVKGSK